MSGFIDVIIDGSEYVERKLSPVYRMVGLEKAVKFSEKFLGELDNEIRPQVETAYAFGTVTLAAGVASKAPPYFIMSVSAYLIGLLHHSAMAKGRKRLSAISEFFRNVDEQEKTII